MVSLKHTSIVLIDPLVELVAIFCVVPQSHSSSAPWLDLPWPLTNHHINCCQLAMHLKWSMHLSLMLDTTVHDGWFLVKCWNKLVGLLLALCTTLDCTEDCEFFLHFLCLPAHHCDHQRHTQWHYEHHSQDVPLLVLLLCHNGSLEQSVTHPTLLVKRRHNSMQWWVKLTTLVHHWKRATTNHFSLKTSIGHLLVIEGIVDNWECEAQLTLQWCKCKTLTLSPNFNRECNQRKIWFQMPSEQLQSFDDEMWICNIQRQKQLHFFECGTELLL